VLRLFTVLCLVLAGFGCQKVGSQTIGDRHGKPLHILATTSMIADAAKQIGGDLVTVDVLMGPGIDPHLYKARPSDTRKLQNADLILFNGLHLEGQIDHLLRQQSHRSFAVADGLPNLRPAEEGAEGGEQGSSGHHDPHVWFDVSHWSKVVERIRDKFAEVDPANAKLYTERAENYLKELTALDSEIRESVGRIPAEKRILITCHDAFGYFGRAYGFQVHGLQGVSTASDASGKDVQALADIIGKAKIRSVFAETSVPDKGLQAVLMAVSKKYDGFQCRLSDTPLYSDSLGEPDGPAGTYIGMVRTNVRTIVAALGE
jgi:manganese/zinc/iron transport system substrate-binding protein